jgi:phenylacetate-CoA ligase
MNDFGLTDAQMFPLLDETGRENLRALREHPHGPRYNWRTGERLTADGLGRVREYAKRINAPRERWRAGELPPWVTPFVDRCRREVPFYRERREWSEDFASIPLTRRPDIRRAPWSFVPDSQPLNELITYTTSGTTGTALQIPATPELPNKYLPLIEAALARVGVRLQGGQRTSIVHVCAQRGTVVLCSISSYLNGAGFAKVNLDPSGWNGPDDALHFLNDHAPELYTGDPFSLSRLSQMQLTARPKAILSAGSALSDGLRTRLKGAFGCPVIDMYSMNESGPIGFSVQDGAHEILAPDLYVEVLDQNGKSSAPGVVGEIVLTGGLNTCLPLVRYATGDFASLDLSGETPMLRSLHGRRPVWFRDAEGQWFTSMDISTALSRAVLSSASVHQNSDGAVDFEGDGDEQALSEARTALSRLLKCDERAISQKTGGVLQNRKLLNYTSDLAPPT